MVCSRMYPCQLSAIMRYVTLHCHQRSTNVSSGSGLVDTQEGSIWTIVLRCDEIYELITQEVFFSCDCCVWDSYFCAPAETQSLPINMFSSETYSFGQTRIRSHNLLINCWTTKVHIINVGLTFTSNCFLWTSTFHGICLGCHNTL